MNTESKLPEYKQKRSYGRIKGSTQPGDKAKNPKPGIPLKKDDILALIHKFRGNISKIADSLGSTRTTVRTRIQGDPELTQALEDARERWIDDIEDSVLNRAAESGDTGLQCFILKTRARHRGYDQDDHKNQAQDIAKAAFDYILNKSKQ